MSVFPVLHYPPLWNKNWLDGSLDWMYAIYDHRVYNIFVDAINERIIASNSMNYDGATIVAGDPLLVAHASAGDYLFNTNPYFDHLVPGWGTIAFSVEIVLAAGRRTYDPVTPSDGLNHGSTLATFLPMPSFYNVGTTFSDDDLNVRSTYATVGVPVRYPFEITNFSATATLGQTARLIGPSSNPLFGTNTGHLFSMGTNTANGGWYLNDAGGTNGAMGPGNTNTSNAGLPDIIEVASNSRSCRGIGRIDAYFLQRLRDAINLSTRFPVNMMIIDYANYDSYSGVGVGNTLADSNASCRATFAIGGPGSSGPDAAWSVDGYGGGFVRAGRATFGIRSSPTSVPGGRSLLNELPNNKQFAIRLLSYRRCAPYYVDPILDTSIFETFGDMVRDGTITTLATPHGEDIFFHDSGIIAASATSYVTSGHVMGGSTYPDGIILANGATMRATTVGYSGGNINCIACYDVAGGFKYTKDYTGS